MRSGTTIHGTVTRASRRALALYPHHGGVHVFHEGVEIASATVDGDDAFLVDVGTTRGLVTVQVDILGAVPVDVDIEDGVVEVEIEIPVNGVSTHNA